MAGDVSISVVIPSKNEGAYLAATVDSLLAGLPADGELIVIDNGSTDGSTAAIRSDPRLSVVRVRDALGPACARNVGAELARGRILLFSDAHVDVQLNWLEPMTAPLRQPEVGATGPVLCDMFVRESKGHGLRFCDSATSVEWLPRNGDEPYPVPALPGFFIAVRREVFAETGGFDEGMPVYGMEDPEFSLHIWALGYQCVLVPAVEVGHLYRHPLPDYQLEWETGLHNILRMGATHFGADRLAGMIRRHAADASFPAAAARLAASDAGRRRSWLSQRRRRDDDWYFAHFSME
jgi:glycosyltransferase involved in cell wall biosynthesis